MSLRISSAAGGPRSAVVDGFIPHEVSFALAGLFLIATGACSDVSGPGEEPREPQDKILFLSSRVGGHPPYGGRLMDVFQMNADGSGVVNLTNDPAVYSAPQISPDGRTVIFSSHKGSEIGSVGCGISDVWTMAPDGSNRKRVACHRFVSLSPDGTMFASQIGDDIYVANIDGSGSRLVTRSLPPATPSCNLAPTHVGLAGWLTPTRPMFFRYSCPQWTSFSVNSDGTGLDTLDFSAQQAYLSPDFRRIAFVGPAGTSVMDVDGSNVRTVSALSLPWFSQRSPWSPDGTRLYLYDGGVSQADGDFGAYYVANLNAPGDVRRLPDPPGTAAAFNGWSPRGDRIAFTVYAATSPAPTGYVRNIYVMNADGTGGGYLTDTADWNEHALWVSGR